MGSAGTGREALESARAAAAEELLPPHPRHGRAPEGATEEGTLVRIRWEQRSARDRVEGRQRQALMSSTT
jgi:hypothetical protein